MADDMRFDDDVVIVTGAGRGLGREHALMFAARGAKVVVNDLGASMAGDGAERTPAQAVVDEICAAGGTAIADYNSVADEVGAAAIVQTARDAFGTVTVLVNNAGIIDYHAFDALTPDRWRAMFAVTADGAYYMARAVWPLFAAQGYGRIVNTTSNTAFGGVETLVHYGAAKAAMIGLTTCLAKEGAPLGITVNAIAPMAVTRMNQEVFFGGNAPDPKVWQEDIKSGVTAIGPPSLVSPAVVWLAHRSTTLNGVVINSSSGRVSRLGFAVGEGYFNPAHSPEDLRDNAALIDTLGQYIDLTSVHDEIASIPPLFGVFQDTEKA